MVDKHTRSRREDVLGADTTGPAVASRYNSIELSKFLLYPERNLFSFRRPERNASLVDVGHQTNNEIPYSRKTSLTAGHWRGSFCMSAKPQGWRPSRWPADTVKVMVGEIDRLGCLVVLSPSRICDIFLCPAPQCKQQMRITYQAGGNWVLARRRSPLDSATQVIVADEVYDDKASADLCEEELTKRLKRLQSLIFG